jgi:hypothetical protein
VGEGFYAVAVLGDAGGSDYLLDVNASAPIGIGDEINNVPIGDAGNTFPAADEIAISPFGSAFVDGSVGYPASESALDPCDYYVFTPSVSGSATVFLTGLGFESSLQDDIDLYLLDASGNVIAGSTNGGTADESINFNFVAGQTYGLWVEPFNDASSEYSLGISGPSLDINDITGFDSPPGADAGDLLSPRNFGTRSGTILIEGGASDSSDLLDLEDAFSFRTAGTGTLAVSLTGVSPTADFDLYVFEFNGETYEILGSSETDGPGDEFISIPIGRSTNVIVVVGVFDGFSQYDLQITAPPPDPNF